MKLLFLLSFALVACTGSDDAITDAMPALQSFDGTVVYQNLEGGFYGIVTARGDELLPANLPAAFEEDGLAVHVEGRFLEGVATIQMWGRPFEITSIERR